MCLFMLKSETDCLLGVTGELLVIESYEEILMELESVLEHSCYL